MVPLFGSRCSTQAPQDEKPAPKKKWKVTFRGAAGCKGCHDRPDAPAKLARKDEYLTWRYKDKHSLAYAVLRGSRGQQIGQHLRVKDAKVWDEPMCLSCHATGYQRDRRGNEFSFADGVSCDGCHGPADGWFREHSAEDRSWRHKTPEEKEKLGMFDVRNPLKRAELCMSCHVGNVLEGKVVTHVMYAAGHPPLPSFEVAGFSQNLPPHWEHLREVPYYMSEKPKGDVDLKKEYHIDSAKFRHTELAMATATVALRTASELLAYRATFGKDGEEPKGLDPTSRLAWPPAWLEPFCQKDPDRRWPELEVGARFKLPKDPRGQWPDIAIAQSDCYACHHELKSPSWRQIRGYMGSPGRPQLPSWPATLAKVFDAPGGDRKKLQQELLELHRVFRLKPFGNPDDVARAAAQLGNYSAGLRWPEIGGPKTTRREAAAELLLKLCSLPDDYFPDYDSARQIASAFRAIYEDQWNNGGSDQEVKDLLIALHDELNLSLESAARRKTTRERVTWVKDHLKDKDREEIEKAIEDRKFLARLDEISEQELRASLDTVSRYNPFEFRKRMARLRALLEK
jgi:hypothetical protein